MARLGVLALQGDFEAHLRSYAGLDVETVEVRRVAELFELDGLVLPGGESTTLLNLMRHEAWFDELREFHAAGKAIFGTCAGAILLAREVVEPAQDSVGLLDATVRRNGFGRQIDSFETELEVVGEELPVRAVFIRAPRFSTVGAGVEILARFDDEPVLVRQGNVMAATFHSELTDDRCLQRRFLNMIDNPLPSRATRALAG